MLLPLAIAAGCKAVDDSAVASMDSLTNEAHAIMNDSLNAAARAEVTDTSVRTVGHQTGHSRGAIHTLRAGEDLSAILGQSGGVI